MAKKRTLVPHYTKRNQLVEREAYRIANEGRFGEAALMFERSKEIYNEHKKASVKRGPAPFLSSSPVVDGVRMRYEKGQLVPRT